MDGEPVKILAVPRQTGEAEHGRFGCAGITVFAVVEREIVLGVEDVLAIDGVFSRHLGDSDEGGEIVKGRDLHMRRVGQSLTGLP